MLSLVISIIMIRSSPPDPSAAAADALSRHDYRIAGVSNFWESAHAGKTVWEPYGLKCDDLPSGAYSYGYFVSDAIAQEALDGYAKQKHFLVSYNEAMLRSGRLPAAWNCVTDPAPPSL